MGNSYAPVSVIVARSLLNLVEAEVADLGRIVESFQTEGVLRRFPDGSVCLNSKEAGARFYSVFHRCRRGLAKEGGYRSLEPFAPAQFLLAYPKWYSDMLDPSAFGVAAGEIGALSSPSELNLQSLPLVVCFRRKPSEEIRQRYAEMVTDWLASVSEHGIFDEGPIANVSQDVEFQGLRAHIRVNASASGSHTLNWFVLKALHFGIEVSPVGVIMLSASKESLDRVCPAAGKITHVRLESKQERDYGSREQPQRPGATLPTGIPSDAVSYAELQSKLRLLKRGREDWDDWRVAVYFTDQPNEKQQVTFRELIKAWETMAYFGGFGGKPIDRFKGLHFDPKTESAYFEADMGSGDPTVAVPLLLRVLECYDSAVLAIEAVVFGKEQLH
jgi:hypothetical protein